MLIKKDEYLYEGKQKFGKNYVSVSFYETDFNERYYPNFNQYFFDNKKMIWNCELFVGKNSAQHRKWAGGKQSEHLRTNGTAGLAPLRFAKDCVLEFQHDILSREDILYIEGEDIRRFRAYRYLLRYKNIVEFQNYRHSGLLAFHPAVPIDEVVYYQLLFENPKEASTLFKRPSFIL